MKAVWFFNHFLVKLTKKHTWINVFYRNDKKLSLFRNQI